ncbi:MAG TPA: hypothetical protein PLL30_15400 [Candidatus Krumholzibacteria bacterium]|nr:hypothetical protein [Candidatus Krumholzibacteria bacterium]HPD73156.1 hypothetical protein [Candidatus Krumholzibacteria bacterium]HRY41966.1 hypothetical protein [Candidatus Krumholzibacteria bacterium]
MQNDTYQTEPRPQIVEPGSTAPRSAAEARRRDLPYKIPFLAGFLSGVFPGVGQLYVGYYRHAITLALILAGIITVLAGGDVRGIEPLLGLGIGFTWVYAIIDAVRRAQAVNRALDGFGSEALPETIELPGTGGSMFGGVLLVILGLLLVAHTRFEFDLSWLEEWWPLGLVGLGIWLIWKARQEKSAKAARTPYQT